MEYAWSYFSDYADISGSMTILFEPVVCDGMMFLGVL